MTPSLYDILGIPKDATAEEIKKAYKALAKINHPDKSGGSVDKMAIINHANDVLSEQKKRDRYDATGQDSETPFVTKFMAFIDQVFIRIVEAAPNVDYIDMIASLKDSVAMIESGLKDKETQATANLNKFESVAKRLKYKSDTAIKTSVATKISLLKIEICNIKDEMEFINKCKKVLEEYGYDFDMPAPHNEAWFYSQINNMRPTNSPFV